MACPLYKSLKPNGTSFYAFPGAAEDISAAYQNQNYKMYFSKYVLLNFPKQNLESGAGLNTKPVYWDFENSFIKSAQATPATSYKDQLVESLRNYVANFEVTMKESRTNNTEYYFDNNVLDTPTEKIFWRWCKSLNLIDFEPAIPEDQYFSNLDEFQRNDLNDTSYFKEILWRERPINQYNIIGIAEAPSQFINKMGIEFSELTNFKTGDILKISKFTDATAQALFGTFSTVKVLEMLEPDDEHNQIAVCDFDYASYDPIGIGEPFGKAEIVYHKLVQYIGEVNGINNVQDKTRSYTEVYAHVPDHTGQTPDILFRTKADKNYKPNLIFPILPAQYQPEIKGAELFNNPLVSSPQNYPGSYFGQFDTEDFTYELSEGDSTRRSGGYYGVSGDIDNILIDSTNLDGITLNFDTSHYSKMNIRNKVLTNFDQFNALIVNNLPPKDFEFNAILWYYTVVDSMGNQTTNLYGMSIVDNPDNNINQDELFQGNGLRIPLYKKLVATSTQDGTSYAFSLNLNFNIINENPQDTFNPEAINSLFSFNLFNQAMTNLSKINESFTNIISNQNKVETDIANLKQLFYSQTDLQVINNRITNLESLLKLYSTNQIGNSESIGVINDTTQNPPIIRLTNKDTDYQQVVPISTKNLYSSTGNIPYTVNIPENKNFLINITNDDVTSLVLPNEQKLEIILGADLAYKQSVDIMIDANTLATQNKQLDIYINYKFGDSTPVETKLLETLDLPIYFNSVTQTTNSAKNWKEMSFDIDLSKDLRINTGSILEIPLTATTSLVSNSFKKGDTFLLQDFILGTNSKVDYSGQYTVNFVDTNSYIYLNFSNNSNLVNFSSYQSLPLTINSSTEYLLGNVPNLKLNKGMKVKITRVDGSAFSEIKNRYLVQRQMF